MGDQLFIRFAFYKYIMRFRKKGKSTPRYIRPYEIVKQVSKVAYRLALWASINYIHNVFHVLLLNKYIGELSHVLRI